ncbi:MULTISPECIES: hypothetical protein [Flavobacterium]|uniref:Uncharacterized protein n=1 Tax=Flavobacterium quisquiliarum TaxID=1834436 RepID=A0ABV8WB50_9FLAO|nr:MULTISPECIES: hypothetical protein [Flavobacterium]MBW1657567.1 hypothetical protein [Flavobacterium quisquiliarum]NWK99273.1 hypothetical protein [Flavobacterium collinsii]
MAEKKMAFFTVLANLILFLGAFSSLIQEPADTKANYFKVNVIIISNGENNSKINKSDMEKKVKQIEVQSPENNVKNPSPVH